MKKGSTFARAFFSSLFGVAMLVSGVSVEAAPGGHPAVKPQKVTGVPTFQNTSQIGNMIFTQQETKADQKDYSGAGILDKFEFTRGTTPDFFGRRFYLCTLKEGMDYIQKREPTATDLRLETSIKVLNNRRDTAVDESTYMRVQPQHFTWNTTFFESKDKIGAPLSRTSPGEYLLYVDTYLSYEYVADKLTGRRQRSNILLAGGKLPVIVK